MLMLPTGVPLPGPFRALRLCKQPAEKAGETPQNRPKTAICTLAISPCIMHDIAAAGLYGPPHPLSGGV
jgi:hypothetical protein